MGKVEEAAEEGHGFRACLLTDRTVHMGKASITRTALILAFELQIHHHHPYQLSPLEILRLVQSDAHRPAGCCCLATSVLTDCQVYAVPARIAVACCTVVSQTTLAGVVGETNAIVVALDGYAPEGPCRDSLIRFSIARSRPDDGCCAK